MCFEGLDTGLHACHEGILLMVYIPAINFFIFKNVYLFLLHVYKCLLACMYNIEIVVICH